MHHKGALKSFIIMRDKGWWAGTLGRRGQRVAENTVAVAAVTNVGFSGGTEKRINKEDRTMRVKRDMLV